MICEMCEYCGLWKGERMQVARIILGRESAVGTRSYNYVMDKVVELGYNRYNIRKVQNLGPEKAAAQWLIRCTASFRPMGQETFVSTKRQLKRLPDDFAIEAIDASDSILHHNGFQYLEGLKHLKELKFHFCYWLDDNAVSKVTVYCRDRLERLEIVGCGNLTMKGLLACHTLKKLKVLYICHLPLLTDQEKMSDLETAKQKFFDLLGVVDPSKLKEFFAWINESFSFDKKDESTEGDVAIRQIVEELKTQVPLNAVLPSERCVFPEYGVDSDCNPNTTIHVDSFLYDEEDVDDLCDQGLISRAYCRACGSHTTAPLTFISHSLSVSELKYVFCHLMPSLAGKTLVDVGSRLGGVLYAAYYFSGASKIIGIEMNPDLCKLQRSIVEKHGMQDKVQVICEDMRSQQQLLSSADVVVLNNVFQFFLQPPDQALCWRALRASVKRGAVLVTVPGLDELTGHLQFDFTLDDWLTEVSTEGALKACCVATGADADDLKTIRLYQVK